MSPARGALPAYLSRLAGGLPEAAPRLRPPRSLFPPTASTGDTSTGDTFTANTLTGGGPEAPLPGFADQTDRADQSGPDWPGADWAGLGMGAGGQGAAWESTLATGAPYPADRRGVTAGSGRGGRNRAGEAFGGPADAAGAAAGAAGMAAAPPLAFAPAGHGLSSGWGRGAMADPSLLPGWPTHRSTSGAPGPAVDPTGSPGGDRWATRAPATVPGTGGPEAGSAGPPEAGPGSPGSLAAHPTLGRPTTVQPTGATSWLAGGARPPVNARPALGPAHGAAQGPASDGDPERPGGNGRRAARTAAAGLPAPAGGLPALLPGPGPGPAGQAGNRGSGRPLPGNAPGLPARVSIGTIEVTVVPPALPPALQHPPTGTVAPPAHPQTRPGPDGTGRTSAEAARQAVRGAARRWFGAGQS